MKKNIFEFVLWGTVMASVAGLVTGCGRAAAHPQMPLPQVTVAPVAEKEIVEWSEFTGRVQPVDSVDVRPRVSGYIQKVCFQSGQIVNKGDVLFIIDPRWNQAVFDQRQAEYEQAKREQDRTADLLANKAISVEEADARKARYEERKAALDSARLDLEYTQVRAPISGRVSRALLTEGNYVSGVAGTASLMTTLVSVNPVYVYADMDEDSYLKFSELVRAKELGIDDGGKIAVQMELADETNFSRTGCIESFDNHLDSDMGSILVRAEFSNDDGSLVPGLFARIRIPMSDRHSAVLVNERAIGTDLSQKYVLLLTRTNTVAYQPVQLGPLIDGQRVVRSGLDSGEEIVVNGLERVRPGMAVSAVRESAAVQTAQR
ncbi:MAG TPA: efflux RND transporter periplasmic adaptor subunit [Verrucomicrobiae bacterium]|jgi:RND family efflux transporter MFP subunit|nr:efflux RND transporter periplasmic adaptor subunit [Verrucomicrobiae bacterium]